MGSILSFVYPRESAQRDGVGVFPLKSMLLGNFAPEQLAVFFPFWGKWESFEC